MVRERLFISTASLLVRVYTDEILYVRADGNYSILALTNGKSHTLTFQLHYFEDVFSRLNDNTFVRVGKSLIVNKLFISFINLNEQKLIISDKAISIDIKVTRDRLKELKQLLEFESKIDHG